MERDEKIQLLLDMQEHPEQFSEQELQAMLDDPEVRELMEATADEKGLEYRRQDSLPTVGTFALYEEEPPDPFGIDHSTVRPMNHIAQ